MAITYKEIKEALVDLGFEIDDEVESEYHRLRINAINRSLNVRSYSFSQDIGFGSMMT